MYAAQLAAVPSYRRDLGEDWDIAKIYWGAMSESRLRAGLRMLREAGDTTSFEGMDPEGPLPYFAIKDEDLTAAVDAQEFIDHKMAAMKAHATQITTDGAVSPAVPTTWQTAWGIEFFRIAKGAPGPVGEDGAGDGPVRRALMHTLARAAAACGCR